MQKKFTFSMIPSSIDKFKYKCSQIFLILCTVILALSVFFNITYSIAPVYGESMQPTLNNNFVIGDSASQDRVVLNYLKKCNKGDIIIVKRANNSEGYIYVIKRLIAVGGDTVEVKDNGDVFVNDVLLNEDYTNNTKSVTYSNMLELKNSKPELFNGNKLVVPKNHIFYLGDNRGNSWDCSKYGPVKKSNLIAKVDFIIKSGENIFVSILKQIF